MLLEEFCSQRNSQSDSAPGDRTGRPETGRPETGDQGILSPTRPVAGSPRRSLPSVGHRSPVISAVSGHRSPVVVHPFVTTNSPGY